MVQMYKYYLSHTNCSNKPTKKLQYLEVSNPYYTRAAIKFSKKKKKMPYAFGFKLYFSAWWSLKMVQSLEYHN